MQFNSYLFIIVFLPMSIFGYFYLNRISSSFGLIFLLALSLWFYGYFNIYYLFLIIGSIVVNFFLSNVMRRSRRGVKKFVLLIGLCFNIGIIFYFKYFNFFISNVNQVFRTSYHVKSILLPLGISFFTFQQLSYIIDSYT